MRLKIISLSYTLSNRNIIKMPKRKESIDSKSADIKESKVAKQNKKENTKDNIYVYDGKILDRKSEVQKRDGYTQPIPKSDKDGVLIFPDAKEFRPNMTPKEVLHAGSFGGTYFRPIKSSITGLKYNKMWNELPQDWLKGTH